jgi:hypothetical protein
VDVLVVHQVLVEGVAFSAEPGKTLVVDEGFERVDGSHQHVDAHVELEAVHQEGIGYVPLQHHWLRKDHVFQSIHQLDSPSPRQTHWLQDPVIERVLSAVLPKLLDEGDVFAGQQEGLGDDIEEQLDFAA